MLWCWEIKYRSWHKLSVPKIYWWENRCYATDDRLDQLHRTLPGNSSSNSKSSKNTYLFNSSSIIAISQPISFHRERFTKLHNVFLKRLVAGGRDGRGETPSRRQNMVSEYKDSTCYAWFSFIAKYFPAHIEKPLLRIDSTSTYMPEKVRDKTNSR